MGGGVSQHQGGGPQSGGLTSPHPAGGETEEEMLRVDMLENQLMDLRMRFAQLCYNPDFVSTPWGGHRGTDTPPPPQTPGVLSPATLGTWGIKPWPA